MNEKETEPLCPGCGVNGYMDCEDGCPTAIEFEAALDKDADDPPQADPRAVGPIPEDGGATPSGFAAFKAWRDSSDGTEAYELVESGERGKRRSAIVLAFAAGQRASEAVAGPGERPEGAVFRN